MKEQDYKKIITDYLNKKDKYTLFSDINRYTSEFENIDISTEQLADIIRIFQTECFISKTSELLKSFKQLHHHDFYEILYIKKGKFKFIVDEKKYDIEPGDMLVISPNTLHVLEVVLENTENERYVINVTENYINSLSTENTNLKNVFIKAEETKNYILSFKNEVKKKIENYMDILIKTQGNTDYGADLLYKIKFIQLLLLINNTYEFVEESEILIENTLVSKTIDYIKNNLNKPLTIADIADYLAVSSSTVSHTFKEQTGLSIYRYITKQKMILAKQLIKKNLSLTEIYQLCGFNDYTSFFRCFKKEYNITPKEYAKASSIISK